MINNCWELAKGLFFYDAHFHIIISTANYQIFLINNVYTKVIIVFFNGIGGENKKKAGIK
jgi:hypothetical protein